MAPALTRVATKATDWRFRLQTLAKLDGMDSIDQATVTTALNDKDPNVRQPRFACRSAGWASRAIRCRPWC